MTRHTPLLLLFGACLLAATAAHAERHLVIVVDTSSSMVQNDPQRYTMQLSQVLSDLVGSGDRLSVIRMPRGQLMSFCMERASGSLVLELDAANRAGFKQQLDRLIEFDTGTFFAAPIRTAISLLPHDPSKQRMLLILADSGGLGHCESALTQELVELKRQGVTIAAINLGGSSGAFDSNPAFDFTTSTVDVQGLIDAVALVYQRFLGAKKVQTGEVQNEISVEIAPYVEEAFLVVAADGPIRAVEPLSGHPSAKTIDPNHHGGGATRGLDQVLRGYRIVRLEHPSPGRWRFRASGVNGNAGWMLLQDSAVGARLVSPATMPKGVDVPLEIELFDRRTGQTITDHSRIPGLKTELEVDGKRVSFRDDGTNGDRKAGDGILTATNTFNDTGDKALNVHLQSDFLDRRIGLTTKVVEAAWRLDVLSPKRAEVDRPVTLRVTLQPIGSSSTLQAPERIDVAAGTATATLHDSGNNTFTGTWTPPETGTVQVDYVPIGGSQSAPGRAAIEVVGRLTFGPAVPV
ncbi:MAG TPA: VWA domain-containing protein, partial [Thermoanaerobaculia bacterium]